MKKKLISVIFIVSFVIVGLTMLVATYAATPYVSSEPETGTLSGSAGVVNDSSASGGKGVIFGSQTSDSTEAYHTCYPHAFCDANNQPYNMNGLNIKSVGQSGQAMNYTTLTQMQKIKAKGFNVVRLAMAWQYFQPNPGTSGFDATAFSNLRTAVNNAKAAGVHVILDPIHGTGKGNCSGVDGQIPNWAQVTINGVCQQRIGAINTNAKDYIQKIATDYANEPTVVAIDLANEIQPMPYSDDTALMSMYNNLINHVRAKDADKILMIEPQSGNKLISANALATSITNKSNVVYSVHSYFGGIHNSDGSVISGCTSSGYSSSGIVCGNQTYEGQKGYVYPSITDLNAQIVANLNMLADSRIRLPLLIGEYNSSTGLPNAIQWRKDFVSVLKSHNNISRIVWSFYAKGYPAGTYQCSDGSMNPINGDCPDSDLSATDWGDSSGTLPGNWKPWVNDIL